MTNEKGVEKSPHVLMLTPVETVRHRLMIGCAIFNAGLVDGVPEIDPAKADLVAAMMISRATTQTALDEIEAFAAEPTTTIARLAALVEAMRKETSGNEAARLEREAAAYTSVYRSGTKGPLPK